MEIQSALIVDDSKMAQIVLKKQLISRDITVNMADSGEASIEYLEQAELLPDVIFMDCLMPGMDGFEATRQILANPKLTNIPIVMCTGKESDEDKQKAFDLGTTGYMSKSSTTEPLDAILNELSKQEKHIHTSEPEVDMKEMLKRFEQSSTEIASSIAEKVAEKVASEISLEHISNFTEECVKSSNEQLISLTEQLEDKVIFTVKNSLENTHNYIDEKILKIENSELPALKDGLEESITIAFKEFKAEQDAIDINSTINSTINEIVDKKIYSAIEQNLSTYVKVLLEHEVAQTLIENKIQEQLAEHNSKIQVLELELDSKANKNSNPLSVIAILMGISALAVSLYSLL